MPAYIICGCELKSTRQMPKTYLVPSIKRGFEIIDLLAQADSGLTISHIHRTLRFPLSSAATILYTLEALGYVERSQDSSAYTLSLKLHSLTRQIDQTSLVNRCHELLARLVAESGLTGHLAVLREGNSMYVDRVPAPGLIQVSSYVGMTWPAYCSGVGKALLAFLPPAERKKVLASLTFKKMTPETIVSKAALEKQLLKFQSLGYCWEMNEWESGVGCVAAPVFGPALQVIAAASVSGTTQQIDKRRIPSLGKMVMKYAGKMSSRLGGSPDNS
jgi:IclR family transcriptional regulator, KDG regulon repressor